MHTCTALAGKGLRSCHSSHKLTSCKLHPKETYQVVLVSNPQANALLHQLQAAMTKSWSFTLTSITSWLLEPYLVYYNTAEEEYYPASTQSLACINSCHLLDTCGLFPTQSLNLKVEWKGAAASQQWLRYVHEEPPRRSISDFLLTVQSHEGAGPE